MCFYQQKKIPTFNSHNIKFSLSHFTNEIMDVILKLRKHAKINQDFITADLIRDELDSLGIQIKDLRDGSSWQIKD